MRLTEAEFIAFSEACQEVILLNKSITKFRFSCTKIVIYKLNQSCIKMLDTGRINDRTKHIETGFNFAVELKMSNKVNFEYYSTSNMDDLPKPLQAQKVAKFRRVMGLILALSSGVGCNEALVFFFKTVLSSLNSTYQERFETQSISGDRQIK